MDLTAISAQELLYPTIEDVRRMDEFYVSTSCGAEMPAPWGGTKVVGACHRAEWYRIHGVPKNRMDTPEQLRKMYWGNAIEQAEIELYKKRGIWLASQVGFYIQQYFLKGRIDCFVRNPDTWRGQDLLARAVPKGGVVGVDIKSTWSYGSKGTIDCPPGSKPWPKWEHIIQMAIYHWFYREFADYWQIVYLARDNGTSRCHNIVVTEDRKISVNGEIIPFTIDHIFARLELLLSKINLSEPPGRDFEIVWDKEKLKVMADAGELNKTDTEKARKGNKVVKGDYQCGYCNWARTCWQGVPLPFDARIEDVAA